MHKRHPTQSKDNPHNVFWDSKAWVQYEYQAGNGSLHGLLEYAKRLNLAADVEADSDVPRSVREALSYLLLEAR